MSELEHHIHQFEPIFDENSKVLILGSFPSVKSRENNFYYAHPQNRFWRVISSLTESEMPIDIEEKKSLLIKNNIAIWDVIAECDIIGSSDSSIKNVVPVSIQSVLSCSNIKVIYANGSKAKNLYDKYLKDAAGREIICLPSTSPANAAYSFDRLLNKWKQIKIQLDRN